VHKELHSQAGYHDLLPTSVKIVALLHEKYKRKENPTTLSLGIHVQETLTERIARIKKNITSVNNLAGIHLDDTRSLLDEMNRGIDYDLIMVLAAGDDHAPQLCLQQEKQNKRCMQLSIVNK